MKQEHRITRSLADESATVEFGHWLGVELMRRYNGRAVVFFEGQLGAGKTTMVRGLLASLGHSGVVKSPTYTLLEPYNVGMSSVGMKGVGQHTQEVFHFDLYRINDPHELEFVGFDEIVDGPGLKLFEWAERALAWLPEPDVQVSLNAVTTTEPVSREVSVEFS